MPTTSASRRDLLAGRVILVSGVGPGLGRACARAALDAGADVVMADLDGERAKAIGADLDPSGARTLTARTDITSADDIAALMDAIGKRWDRLDGLVNVAALDTPTGGLLDGDLDDWDRVASINVRGTLEMTRASVPLMTSGGSVVIIGSIGAVRPRASTLRLYYGASKGALLSAAHYLATELGAKKIRVNTVAPGWKWGPVLAGYVEQLSASTGRAVEDIVDGMRADSPLHEVASDDDVADAVLFFLSDLAAKVSGQTLYVDAGSYLH